MTAAIILVLFFLLVTFTVTFIPRFFSVFLFSRSTLPTAVLVVLHLVLVTTENEQGHTHARTNERTHARTHATHLHPQARTRTHLHLHARTRTHLHPHASTKHTRTMSWKSSLSLSLSVSLSVDLSSSSFLRSLNYYYYYC